MDIEWAQLVIPKSAYDPATVLCGWADILDPTLSVLLPTRLGHLFLSRADGTVWFLNTWSGELTQVSESYEQFRVRVAEDDDFMSRYLMPEVVAALLGCHRTAKPGHEGTLQKRPARQAREYHRWLRAVARPLVTLETGAAALW